MCTVKLHLSRHFILSSHTLTEPAPDLQKDEIGFGTMFGGGGGGGR